MSTISASTTTTTAYVVTADTTGTLVLQTGATPTTALTLSSAQLMTLPNDASISGLTVGKGGGAVAGNTAFGLNALAATATGAANTGVGQQALNAVTSGAENSAYGLQAMLANTTGGQNTALGTYALKANTTASNNTAVGYQAGYNNTVGQFNVLLGYQAGYRSAGTGSIGDASVLIGYQAGYANQGNNNVGIGNGALSANTSGTFNTCVGQGSGSAITTGGKNVILGGYSGNASGIDIRTASNYIVLSDGDGTPKVISNPDSNLISYYGVGSGFSSQSGLAYSKNAMSSKSGSASSTKQATAFTIKYFQGNNGWEIGNLVIYSSASKLNAATNTAAWWLYSVMHYDTNWSLTLKASGGDTGNFSITSSSPASGYNTQKTVTLTITTVVDADTSASQVFYSEYNGIYSIT